MCFDTDLQLYPNASRSSLFEDRVFMSSTKISVVKSTVFFSSVWITGIHDLSNVLENKKCIYFALE